MRIHTKSCTFLIENMNKGKNNEIHPKLTETDAKTSEGKKAGTFMLLHVSITPADTERNFPYDLKPFQSAL